MTVRWAKQLLDGFLNGVISPLGFQHVGRLEYARREIEAAALLSWPCRLDPRGFAAFTCGVGVYYECLARWLSDNPKQMVATVATPIHFLREDKLFTEWRFSNAADLENKQGPILNDLNDLALPFIERYSKLSNVRAAVASSNAMDWVALGLNRDSRINVLATIQFVEGDKTGALRTLDEALAERMTALPRRRFDIEYLRKRLIETG